jgi:hypothetical protein
MLPTSATLSPSAIVIQSPKAASGSTSARNEASFGLLSPEVLELVYRHLASEPLSALTTCGYRKCLPLALTCRAYYATLIIAVRGLAVLPLGFASRRSKTGKPPPSPFSANFAPGKRARSASSIAKRCSLLTVGSETCEAAPTLPEISSLISLPSSASSGIASWSPFAAARPDRATRNKTTDYMVQRMVAALPNLVDLELSLAVALTDAGVFAVAQFCPNLCSLRVTGNSVVTDVSLRTLGSFCPRLRTLDMSYCTQMSDSAAAYLIDISSLEKLNVTKWGITDDFLRALCRSGLLKLNELELSCCENLTDVGMSHLARGANIQLLRLSVRGCRSVGDAGLDAIVRACPRIQLIDVSYNDNLSPGGLGMIGELSCLRSLNATQCRYLTDATAELLARCVRLERVNLSWCCGLTDVGVGALVAKCTGLKDIKLSGCHFLTDVGVEFVAQLDSLDTVVLSYCKRLTGKAADALGLAQNRPLTEVDLRRCENIPVQAIDRLRERVSLLHETCGTPDEDLQC